MQPLPDLKTLSHTEKDALIILLSQQVEHPNRVQEHVATQCNRCHAGLSAQASTSGNPHL